MPLLTASRTAPLVLGEWLYDDARQAGDSAVLEDSDSSN